MVPARLLVAILLTAAVVRGVNIEFSTLIGGNGHERASSVWADSSGRAYFLGTTTSPNLVTTDGALRPACGSDGLCDAGNADLFVGRLSADGSRFEFLTYLGGSLTETAKIVRADPLRNVVVGGRTDSPDFLFSGDLFGEAGAEATDFLAKLTPSGSRLAYSLPLPEFTLADAAFDSFGNLWILGSGERQMPTTPDAPQPRPQTSSTPYVARIDPSGTTLLFATYWGGNRNETAGALAIDTNDNVTICGLTTSANFPVTPGALKSEDVLPDFFIARFRPEGQVAFSTRFGGSDRELFSRCVVDGSGSAHFLGSTVSTDFPWTNSPPPASLNSNLYARISADGASIVQAAFLPRAALNLAAGEDGDTWFIGGESSSSDGAFVQTIEGTGELVTVTTLPYFVSRFDPGAAFAGPQGSFYLFANPFIARFGSRPEAATPGAVQTFNAGKIDAGLAKVSKRLPVLRVEPSSALIQSTRATQEDLILRISIRAPSRTRLPFHIRAEDSWVIVPTYGSNGPYAVPEAVEQPFAVRVRVTPPSSDPGVYETAVIVGVRGGIGAPIRVPIRYELGEVSNRTIRRTLLAKYVIGDPLPIFTDPSLSVQAGRDQTVEYVTSEPWVTVSEPHTSSSDALLDPTGLAPGTYRANILVRRSPPLTEDIVPVLLSVQSPQISLRPGSLHLIGDTASDRPAEAEILVDIPGSFQQRQVLRFASAETNQAWLNAAIRDDSVPGRVLVVANAEGLVPGRYSAVVTILTKEAVPNLEVPVVFSVVDRPPFSVNPASLAYLVPSEEMLVGQREILVDSGTPLDYRAEIGRGLSLAAEPPEGVTPATLHVSIDAGVFDFSGEGEILVHAGGSTIRVPVALSKRPLTPKFSSLVNAASFTEGFVAPESLATIFGEQLSFAQWVPDKLPLESSIFNTGVRFSAAGPSQATPFVFMSPRQLNIQIPNFQPGPARLSIQVNSGNITDDVTIQIAEAAPGIFTYGDNHAVVQNEDISVNSTANGAAPGSVGVLFLTGQGPLDREVLPGHAAPADPLARATIPAIVTVGGREAEVLFAGLAPGFVGLCQVNFRFPDLPPGNHPITIGFGGVSLVRAGRAIRIVPDTQLLPNTLYSYEISAGVRDLDGRCRRCFRTESIYNRRRGRYAKPGGRFRDTAGGDHRSRCELADSGPL